MTDDIKILKDELKRANELIENLTAENIRLKDKLQRKKARLTASNDNLYDHAEKIAEDILRNNERYNRPIVVNANVVNYFDSPRDSPKNPLT